MFVRIRDRPSDLAGFFGKPCLDLLKKVMPSGAECACFISGMCGTKGLEPVRHSHAQGDGGREREE